MSDINSVIIEGIVEANEGFFANMCCVTIKNSHCKENKNGKKFIEINRFNVISYGKLGELISDQAFVNRKIVVVGRIKSTDSKEVEVIAEHVDFKPFTPKEVNDENQN